MVSEKSGGLREFFIRKKSTYGMVLPEEDDSQIATMTRSRRHRHRRTDCFVPSDMDKWELPQYESLFNHLLVTQDGQFRRRLSSTASTKSNEHENEDAASHSDEGTKGPLRAVKKWFQEVIKSIAHQSYDLGGDVPVDGIPEIPVDICEKLRNVHVYL